MTRARRITKTIRGDVGDDANPYRQSGKKQTARERVLAHESARASRRNRSLRWWEYTDGEHPDEPSSWKTHLKVFSQVDRIWRRTAARRRWWLYYACMYGDAELIGLGPSSYEPRTFEPTTLAFNVMQQNVDTLTALITRNEPLPMPVTNGGDWTLQRRARKFGRFTEGMFDDTGVWRKAPSVVRDAGLLGTGLAYNYRVGSKIFHDRLFPWDLIVDPREAHRGAPRTVYLRRWLDRGLLIDQYPEFEEQIENASTGGAGYDPSDLDLGYDETSDQLLVVGAWHLPSPFEPSDGRPEEEGPGEGQFALCISNATLRRPEYKRHYFPFPRLVMTEPLMGYFGSGLGALLSGLQYTINDGSMRVQENQALAGNYLYVPDTSDVSVEDLDNAAFRVIKGRPGMQPTPIIVPPGHPDSWNFVMSLLPWASNISGVSQTTSQGTKPPGVTAARALEHLSDEQSGRFGPFSKNYERYCIENAWQQFDLAEEIVNEGGSYVATASSKRYGRRTMEPLDFSEVRLARDQYTLQVFPTSLLPHTPAGRINTIQQLSDAGWISSDEAKMLLDFPDLERTQNLAQAAWNIVQRLVDRMLDATDYEEFMSKSYVPPEPLMNLDLCVRVSQQAYLDAKAEGASSDDPGLRVLRDFIVDARTQKQQADAAAAAPPQAAPPGPPGAPPPGAPPPPAMPPGPPQPMPPAAA